MAGRQWKSTDRRSNRDRTIPHFTLGTLNVMVTVEDLKAYTRPWTVTIEQELVVDTDMLDVMCLENEKDVQHLP